MRRFAFFLLAAAAAFAAEDTWSKVKELKSGSEVRIFKKGSTKAVEGKLDEARDEDVVIVLKTEQVAIPKDQIDRIDARPSKGGGRTTESKVTSNDTADPKPPAGMAHGAPVPGGGSYSTSTSFGSKPDFQTVYRRAAAPAAKK